MIKIKTNLDGENCKQNDAEQKSSNELSSKMESLLTSFYPKSESQYEVDHIFNDWLKNSPIPMSDCGAISWIVNLYEELWRDDVRDIFDTEIGSVSLKEFTNNCVETISYLLDPNWRIYVDDSIYWEDLKESMAKRPGEFPSLEIYSSANPDYIHLVAGRAVEQCATEMLTQEEFTKLTSSSARTYPYEAYEGAKPQWVTVYFNFQ